MKGLVYKCPSYVTGGLPSPTAKFLFSSSLVALADSPVVEAGVDRGADSQNGPTATHHTMWWFFFLPFSSSLIFFLKKN